MSEQTQFLTKIKEVRSLVSNLDCCDDCPTWGGDMKCECNRGKAFAILTLILEKEK